MGDPQPWNAIEDSNPSNGELAPVCTARVAFWLDFSIAYVRLFCAALRPLDCGSWLTNGLRFFRASLTWGPGCWRLSAPGQRYARTDLARHRMSCMFAQLLPQDSVVDHPHIDSSVIEQAFTATPSATTPETVLEPTNQEETSMLKDVPVLTVSDAGNTNNAGGDKVMLVRLAPQASHSCTQHIDTDTDTDKHTQLTILGCSVWLRPRKPPERPTTTLRSRYNAHPRPCSLV